MKLLTTHSDVARADLFGLSCHDIEAGKRCWVDLRPAPLDPAVDRGFQGICSDGSKYYLAVASMAAGRIVVLDSGLRYESVIELGGTFKPGCLAVESNVLYVASSEDGRIVCIDLETGQESIHSEADVDTRVVGLAFDRGEGYALCWQVSSAGRSAMLRRLADGATVVEKLEQAGSLWVDEDGFTLLECEQGQVMQLAAGESEPQQLVHLGGCLRGLTRVGADWVVGVSARWAGVEGSPDDYPRGLAREPALLRIDASGCVLAEHSVAGMSLEIADLQTLVDNPADGVLVENPEAVLAQYRARHSERKRLDVRSVQDRDSDTITVPAALAQESPPGLVSHLQHALRMRRYRDDNDSFVRGAWYFSDAWPLNFWSNVEEKKARRELGELQAMGFNAVFIVIPWIGFQPDISVPDVAEHYMERARTLVSVCENLGLQVYARVNYGHAICDDSMGERDIRVETLLTDESCRLNWLAYLSALDGLSSSPSVKGFFLSWEDFWHTFTAFQARDDEARLALARSAGYQDFLRKNCTLHAYNQDRFDHEKLYLDFSEIEIPQPDSTRHFYYLHFMNHSIRRLFRRGCDVISPLSMETRVDWDQYREPDGSNRWFRNDAYPDLQMPTMSYWAPFMMAENQGEVLSGQKALQNFAHALDRYPRGDGISPPIIEQFNFVDDTPNFAGTHATIDPEQVAGFLDQASGLLVEQTAGYALWAVRSYYQNLLINASFALAGEGWDADPVASCTFCSVEDETVVELAGGATIAQSFIPRTRGMGWIHQADRLLLRVFFHPRSKGKLKRLKIALAGHEDKEVETSDVSLFERLHFSGTHRGRDQMILSIENLGSPCLIERVCLYSYEFDGQIMGPRGFPIRYYDDVVRLNRRVREYRRRQMAEVVLTEAE